MSTREDIRAAAAANGWVQTSTGHWFDAFTRPVALAPESGLARALAVAGHQPAERVFVGYNGELSRQRLDIANFSGPSQQSALSGVFVGVAGEFAGRNKRAQVITHLTRRVDIHPIVEDN